jgi:leucyl aminopeptidase
MPILPEHTNELKGVYSDHRSTGSSKSGGACTAAAFLQKFVDNGVEWAHIDIGNPSLACFVCAIFSFFDFVHFVV